MYTYTEKTEKQMYKILITSWITGNNRNNVSASVSCAIHTVVAEFETEELAAKIINRINCQNDTRNAIALF